MCQVYSPVLLSWLVFIRLDWDLPCRTAWDNAKELNGIRCVRLPFYQHITALWWVVFWGVPEPKVSLDLTGVSWESVPISRL